MADLTTPIFIAQNEMEWPQDPIFYILASNGLFRCRNHKFFVSAALTQDFPAELAEQKAFLKLHYPKIPMDIFERIVGFFEDVYYRYCSEAIILLEWDTQKEEYIAVCPVQRVSCAFLFVEYDNPVPIYGRIPVATIHSHADSKAGASGIDIADEKYKSGIHIIVGKIREEPPEISIEAVVDGNRFVICDELILDKYNARRKDFPPDWLNKITVINRLHSTYKTSATRAFLNEMILLNNKNEKILLNNKSENYKLEEQNPR